MSLVPTSKALYEALVSCADTENRSGMFNVCLIILLVLSDGFHWCPPSLFVVLPCVEIVTVLVL